MPYKNPQSAEAKASQKRRSERYIEKNREKYLLTQKNNNNKRKEYIRKHQKLPRSIMLNTIRNWKRIGVIYEDYEELYENYLYFPYCMTCEKEFKNTLDKHLDHDHKNGRVLGFLCRSCNTQNKH